MSLYKKFIKTDNINNVFSSYDISEKTATLKSNLLHVNSDTIIFITDPSVGNYIYTKGSLFGGIDSNGVASGEMDYDYINENFISKEEFTEFVESGNFSGSENIDTSNLLEKSSFEEYVTDVSNNYARKTDLNEFISDASAQNYVLNVSNYVSENYITNSSLNQIIIDTSSYIANNYVTKSEFEDHVENCGSSEDIIKEDSLDGFTIYDARLMSFPNNSEELSSYTSVVDYYDNIDTDYIYDGNFSALMQLFMSETILTDIETAYENNPDLGTFLLDLIDYMNQNSEMIESPDYILACIANELIMDPQDLQALSLVEGIKLMFRGIEKIAPLYVYTNKILYNICGNLYFPIYTTNMFLFFEVDKNTLLLLRAFIIEHNDEDGTTVMTSNNEVFINMYVEDDNREVLTYETLPNADELTTRDLNNSQMLYLLLGKSLISGLYKENGKSEWDKDEVIYDTMCFPFDIVSPLKSPSRNLNNDSNTYLSYTDLKNDIESILGNISMPEDIQYHLVNNPGVTIFTNRHMYASEDGQYAIDSFDKIFDMINIISKTILDSDEDRLGAYVFLPKAKNEYWLFTNVTRLTYIEADPYDYISISLPIYAVNIEKNVITHGSFDYNLYTNNDFVDLSSDSFISKLEQYKKSAPSTTEIEGELSDMDEITRTFVKMFVINSSASANASAELSAIKGDIDTLAEFISKQHIDIEKTNSMVLDFNEKLSNVELVLLKKINNLSNKIDFQNYLMHTIVNIDTSSMISGINGNIGVNYNPTAMSSLRIPEDLKISVASENTIRQYIHDSMAQYAVGMISLEETAALLNFSSTVLCLSNMIYTAIPNGSTFNFLENALYSINPGTLCGRMETNDTYLLRLDVFINPYAHIFLKRFNLSQDAWTHWAYYLPGWNENNINFVYEDSISPTAYSQGYNSAKNYMLENFEVPTIGDQNTLNVDINNPYDLVSNPDLYAAFIDGCNGAKAYMHGYVTRLATNDSDNPYIEDIVLRNEYDKGFSDAPYEDREIFRNAFGASSNNNQYESGTHSYKVYELGYECGRLHSEGYNDGYTVGYAGGEYEVNIDENVFTELFYKLGYEEGYQAGYEAAQNEATQNEGGAE